MQDEINEKTIALYIKTGEADRADASKGYENAACTDEEAERQNAAGQADLKAAYEAERGRFQH